jgi:tetratricopeptide repeat protein 30
MVPTSAEEAYRKFDELAARHIEKLRRLTKQIQDARLARDNETIKSTLKLYDEELEKYIPVLMAQARIYWDRENYPMVEKLFFQSAEFCSEHEVWKLNVAHVFFMQETKFKDAIRYYDPIVKRLQLSLNLYFSVYCCPKLNFASDTSLLPPPPNRRAWWTSLPLFWPTSV